MELYQTKGLLHNKEAMGGNVANRELILKM